jgi:phosphate-selective porin OprO/OprP
MIPRGEVGLIFAQMGLSGGVFDAKLFSAVALVVTVTTFLAPPPLRLLVVKNSAGILPEPQALEEAITDYLESSINWAQNGEASTNASFITSSGVPFFAYNPNVRAMSEQIRATPHFYWYGRMSVLAEYMLFSRELTDNTTTGRSTQRAYYVNLSYFLTGERDYQGNGFQGYSTVTPLRPFIPSRGQWGPGAWQLACQFSVVNVGNGDFARGFADPSRYTNRLDQLMCGGELVAQQVHPAQLRLGLDWIQPRHPLNMPEPISTFQTFWLRFAMFF